MKTCNNSYAIGDEHIYRIHATRESITNLIIPLPEKIKETEWDVIFVDAPVGNSDESAGRMQSIYTAYTLANNKTNIFVHDCNRTVENVYTNVMFNTIKNIRKLRHLKK